jgi:ubiquinone biosynthesis protein UbiJ
MNTTSPFSFLQSLASRLQPPHWVVDEAQHRLILFLNHVLMQEKEAQNRLARKKGSVIHARWGIFEMDLLVTPAGLFDRAESSAKRDLMVSVAADTPLLVFQALAAGKVPPVNIEGDVQLAAELGWLADNLRWDVEEDMSRLLGDIPAHAIADAGRKLADALKGFLFKNRQSPAAGGEPGVNQASTQDQTGRAGMPTAGSASGSVA